MRHVRMKSGISRARYISHLSSPRPRVYISIFSYYENLLHTISFAGILEAIDVLKEKASQTAVRGRFLSILYRLYNRESGLFVTRKSGRRKNRFW